MRRVALIVLATIALVAASQTSGFSAVVSSLSSFQTQDGGFRITSNPNEEASLEATSHALFLSSLYGLKNQINAEEAAKYIQERENSDGGYGKKRSWASDIESVRHALLGYQHLGLTIPNSEQAISFVQSLYDEEKHSFRNRAGEKPDLKSTAIALECLNILGELQHWPDNKIEAIKSSLDKHAVRKGGVAYFSFPEEESLSLVSANYYGIALGALVNYDLKDLTHWAAFIKGQQSQDGGIFADAEKSTVTLESTTHATSSLRALQTLRDSDANFVDTLDIKALLRYLHATPRDLRSAAAAHLAVASTKSFTDNMRTSLSYLRADSTSVGEDLVQGEQIKPILTVTTFNSIPHAGLEVDVEVTFPKSVDGQPGQKLTSKMQWSQEHQQYMADQEFDTAGHLGDITFEYILRCYVSTLGGVISFEVSDKKRIGYAIDVTAAASFSGKALSAGEPVAVHTAFDFKVKLSNGTEPNLVSGAWKVEFKVLDASEVVLASKITDGAKNTEPIAFDYTLEDAKLPSGKITFLVAVSNAQGVHTSHATHYPLSLQMVATQIQLETSDVKFGEKVKVSMQPATLDGRTVIPYPAGPKNSLASKRVFYMDVKSPGGVLLDSIKGVAHDTNGASKYVFETSVKASLQSVGKNLITFRYAPASGEGVTIANYDTDASELYEDSHSAALSYTVVADLRMVDVTEKPSQTDLAYGSDISFRFGIKDVTTGKRVGAGAGGSANAFMLLQHSEAGHSTPIVTAREAARAELDAAGAQVGFAIRWSINANAVTGPGLISLVVTDADGKQLPLSAEGSKEAFKLPVKIGGEIDVVEDGFYSSALPAQAAAVFAVQFRLKCKAKFLADALLRAVVRHRASSSGDFTPVEALKSMVVASNSTGSYQVSWTLPHAQAASGEYQVQLFREIDQERKSAKEADASSYELKPFIELVVPHQGPATSLPIKMDLLVMLAMIGAVVGVTKYKENLMGGSATKAKRG